MDKDRLVVVNLKLHIPLDIAQRIMEGKFKIMSLGHNAEENNAKVREFEIVDAECSMSRADKLLLDEYIEKSQN